MTTLVTVEEFRAWAGAGTASVTDDAVLACLDEAEAGIVADVGVNSIAAIAAHQHAAAIAAGDQMRRAANFLARRNSPEGIAGSGDEGIITVPAGDPSSPQAVRRVRRLLRVAAGGSVVVA